MSSGGLMQLVAYGASDRMLMADMIYKYVARQKPKIVRILRWLIKNKHRFCALRHIQFGLDQPESRLLPELQTYIVSYLSMTDIYSDYFGLYRPNIDVYRPWSIDKSYYNYQQYLSSIHPIEKVRELFRLAINTEETQELFQESVIDLNTLFIEQI